MKFEVTNAASEYISDLSSEMLSNSVTEQPVITIFFKGTTTAIWGTGGSDVIPAYLKLTVDVTALEDIQKEEEKFSHSGDYEQLDIPIFIQELAEKHLVDPTIIDAKGWEHLRELYITNAPILIENTFWKK